MVYIAYYTKIKFANLQLGTKMTQILWPFFRLSIDSQRLPLCIDILIVILNTKLKVLSEPRVQ